MKFFLSVELTALDNVDYYTGLLPECQGFFQKKFQKGKKWQNKGENGKNMAGNGRKIGGFAFFALLWYNGCQRQPLQFPSWPSNVRPAILLRKNRGKLIGYFMVQWLRKTTIVVPTLPPKVGQQFAGRRTPVETYQMFYGTMVAKDNHCSSPLGRPMSDRPFCFAKIEGNSSDILWYNGCERQPLWFPPCR